VLDPEWRAFVAALQWSWRLPVLASAIVHEGRRLLDVDRLTLLWGPASRLRIKAVSGVSGLHAHSPALGRLQELVRRTVASGEPLVYQAGITEIPAELEDDLAAYVEVSQAQYLAIVPLTTAMIAGEGSETGVEDPEASHRPRRPRLLGAVVLERWSAPVASEALLARGDDFLALVAGQLRQALRISWIPLKEFFAGLGEFLFWLRGSKLAIAAALVLTLLSLGVALAVVPYPYRIDARGRILPTQRQQVFAPWDGQIEELRIRSGQLVSEGELLLVVRNDERMAEAATVYSRWLELQKQIVALISQVEAGEREARFEEALRLQGELAVARRELAGVEKQRELLQIRQERLVVRAPLSGRVTTFQLAELLTGRPVRRGDALLEIADEASPWRLELDVQEHRAGRLLVAFEKWGARPVTYRVLTQPEATWSAILDEIGSRTVMRPEQGQVLEAHAPIVPGAHPALAIGADVWARIDCGPTVLGDALFGDIVEFARRWLWW
jgi:multidrug efflux pump subunit AcrA (membrane-fusion protein)